MSKKENIHKTESIHSEPHTPGSHESESQDTESLHAMTHNSSIDSSASYQEGYRFVVSEGALTSLAEVEHGITKSKLIKPYETY